MQLQRRIPIGIGLILAAMVMLAIVAACGPLGRDDEEETAPGFTPEPVNEELARQGEQLFAELGCIACHSTTGQEGIGPPLDGLYGTEVELADGETVIADAAYLRESILEPDAKIVAGYSEGVMAGAIAGRMDEIQQGDNVEALVEYIKSLR